MRPTGYCRLNAIRSMLNRLYNAALEQRERAKEERQESVRRFDQFRWLTQLRRQGPEALGALAPGRGAQDADPLGPCVEVVLSPLQRMECIDVVRINGFSHMRLYPAGGLREGGALRLVRIVRKPHGVRARMTLSDGSVVEAAQLDWPAMRRQRQAVSRYRQGSRRRRQRLRRLAALRDGLKVRNRNACHRAGTRNVRGFGVIAVKDLRIRNTTAAARGTLQEPGRNVRAKAVLNRSVLTQTWGIIRDQLRHKAQCAGREFVAVNPVHTPQDRHCCAQRRNPNLSRVFRRSACGPSVDRDLNAAINIHRAGSLALASRT